jgi:plasmid stabilization system protein ParE
MSIRLLDAAEAELDEAVSYYNSLAPLLGESFLIEVLRVFNLISAHPLAWHPLGDGIRRCRTNRFPYAVVYFPVEDEILVLAIANLHRRPGYWADRIGKV